MKQMKADEIISFCPVQGKNRRRKVDQVLQGLPQHLLPKHSSNISTTPRDGGMRSIQAKCHWWNWGKPKKNLSPTPELCLSTACSARFLPNEAFYNADEKIPRWNRSTRVGIEDILKFIYSNMKEVHRKMSNGREMEENQAESLYGTDLRVCSISLPPSAFSLPQRRSQSNAREIRASYLWEPSTQLAESNRAFFCFCFPKNQNNAANPAE